MDQEELKAKLLQIEEQATLTLNEFPKTLTKERQRMIIALARYLRTELENSRFSSLDDPVDFGDDGPLENSRH